MVEVVRCFICVELEEKIRKKISRWIEELKILAPRLKWVSEEGLHITLKFCGEINLSKVIKLENALQDAFARETIGPFDLEIAGVGAFPGLRVPRVLWLGIGGEEDQLVRVVEVVECAAEVVGLEREHRPFHPHVTIARVKSPSDVPVDLIRTISDHDLGQLSWKVNGVTLMKSELKRTGSIYTPIAKYQLNQPEVS